MVIRATLRTTPFQILFFNPYSWKTYLIWPWKLNFFLPRDFFSLWFSHLNFTGISYFPHIRQKILIVNKWSKFFSSYICWLFYSIIYFVIFLSIFLLRKLNISQVGHKFFWVLVLQRNHILSIIWYFSVVDWKILFNEVRINLVFCLVSLKLLGAYAPWSFGSLDWKTLVFTNFIENIYNSINQQ